MMDGQNRGRRGLLRGDAVSSSEKRAGRGPYGGTRRQVRTADARPVSRQRAAPGVSWGGPGGGRRNRLGGKATRTRVATGLLGLGGNTRRHASLPFRYRTISCLAPWSSPAESLSARGVIICASEDSNSLHTSQRAFGRYRAENAHSYICEGLGHSRTTTETRGALEGFGKILPLPARQGCETRPVSWWWPPVAPAGEFKNTQRYRAGNIRVNDERSGRRDERDGPATPM
jgi:hypothetical protein